MQKELVAGPTRWPLRSQHPAAYGSTEGETGVEGVAEDSEEDSCSRSAVAASFSHESDKRRCDRHCRCMHREPFDARESPARARLIDSNAAATDAATA